MLMSETRGTPGWATIESMKTAATHRKTIAFTPSAVWCFTVIIVCVWGCDQSDTPALPTSRTEMDQQVKRLREDTEIELRDLRGRWLAVEGLLTKQRDRLAQDQRSLENLVKRVDEQLAQMEVHLGSMEADINALKRITREPSAINDVLERLARSYEEIYCLRKRGQEEQVGAVYGRYGFEDLSTWSKAWTEAARSLEFEQEVNARVAVLCP
jgi:uncharacterized protein YhaN